MVVWLVVCLCGDVGGGGGGGTGVYAHDGLGLWCSLTWGLGLELLLCVQEGMEDRAWVAHVCSMASEVLMVVCANIGMVGYTFAMWCR